MISAPTKASELRKALDIRNTCDMSEDEYIDYLATMREDGKHDPSHYLKSERFQYLAK